MHIDQLRKAAGGVAAIALINCIYNVANYGGNPNGIFTFMYIGTILAIVSQIFMIAATFMPDHHRNGAMKHSMIAVIAILIVDVVFAIPSISWIIDFSKLGSGSQVVGWIIRFTVALVLQIIASILFIKYSRMHSHGGHNGYIPAPHGLHH